MAYEPTPIRIGSLFDFPQGDGGAYLEQGVGLGIEHATAGHGGLDRPVEFVLRESRGLPIGSEHELLTAFDEVADAGVVAIVGPSISDNCLLARDAAERHRVPTINYSGGERTRGPWMFHYQVGSLEEEPVLIARYLHDQGLGSAAVLYDRSPVGQRYAEVLQSAAGSLGVELTGIAPISALAQDLSPTVARLRQPSPDALVYLGLGVAARATALAVADAGWDVPVVCNSALMFGYQRKEWRADWDGWVYVDTVADDNPERQQLAEHSRRHAASPIGCAAYDIGRLLGHALATADHLTRDGIRQALESVKWLPAASGLPGTQMGFGVWDHGALKGHYLVLRSWRDGATVQVS